MDPETDKPPNAPDWFTSQIQSSRSELINLARRKHVPPDDCEDIASEAITQAIRNQANYDPGRGPFWAWIKTIGENVINTYWRRQYAQKRKAVGDVISLDALSIEPSSKDKRRDRKDAFVEKQRALEELEHFVHAASLSEKERKAIASRLGKEAEQAGAEFSPSTDRRAMEKLKQAKADEKFREQPADARLSECAYGTIPAAEHDTALLYDVLRRTAWFVDAADRWKKSVEWKETAIQLEKERGSGRFPLTILPRYWPEEFHRYYRKANDRSPRLRRRFEAAVEIVLAISEWPKLSYCCLDPKKRRHQLEQFGWMFGEEPFWEINERTFELFVDAVEPQPLPNLSAFLEMINKAPESGSETYNSVHIVRVDWRFPLKSIVTSFEKWAAGEKIQWRGIPKIQRAGRPRNRLLLGYAFGRLTSEFGLSKGAALSWLKKRYGRPMSTSPERIGRAAKHAHDTLKDFLPTPAEIGL
jgi:DNA-directed RNA polymerase specialized sigma24 family protein